ncbi:hypothetical protein QQS45_10800 [Alteriqipengyuania flavescens]|uniref:hypothetical protein n=1 Tax=Alteriqipengyuania flavescens TaxID=3053610 RepID=UPI0025B4A51D|nr:hypothetical protein [Alteriqipengyuania flavescens]WJY18106.1 hypothetical protein QQW98_10795 [Alteriqipengyuania flavescens]WJY24047.1 hypothetical protein QQS45_10800 [Alteriqipengyuania flavescens]
MGILTIARQKKGWRDLLRAYCVEVDGEDVGKVRRGETFRVDLPAGSHSVRLKIDWCSSQTIEVDGEADTLLHCAPGGTALTALPDIMVFTDHYITLVRG